MNGYNSEFDGNHDWDDRGDLAWNEHDWQQYLKQQGQEVIRFLSFYKKLKHQPTRLDEIAQLMGWDQEDWNNDVAAENNEPAPASEDQGIDLQSLEEDHSESEDLDPYTVHRHPVYIVTNGLYRAIRYNWRHLVKTDTHQLDGDTVMEFSQSLSDGEYQAMMGIHALDMGDFTLCVCHLKHALTSLNHSLGLLHGFPLKENRSCAQFHAETLPMLFDLRELWLRVMTECREVNRRR